MRQANSTRKGFTLIELLIVVAIIGILAAIAVPNFLNAQVRAKIARAQADLKSLGTAVEMYALDNNVYPCDGQEPDCRWYWNYASWRLTTPIAYISQIPLDPWALHSPFVLEGEDTRVKHYWYATREGYGGVRSSGRAPSVRGRDNVRLFDPPRQKYRYAFVSTGPDTLWEWDRPTFPQFAAAYAGDVLYYDSSNGIVSSGDLYLYGPGNTFNPPSAF